MSEEGVEPPVKKIKVKQQSIFSAFNTASKKSGTAKIISSGSTIVSSNKPTPTCYQNLSVAISTHGLKIHDIPYDGNCCLHAILIKIKTYQNKVTRNTKSMLSIIDVILALGCRGLPLRGDWDEKVKKDLGNFQFFIDWKSKMDNDLNQHLQTAPRNAKYLSPKVQNELISCIETEIRESIVQKLNNSKFFSIMADETTDISTKEQVAICFRYLERTDDGYVVNEDFLGFADIAVADAKTISDTLIQKMKDWGINTSNLRGQGYDGASVMTGHVNGVLTKMKAKYPKAKFFTHCANHCLNLVIVASCKNVVEIRNFMSSLQQLTFFFTNSAKRKAILTLHMKTCVNVENFGDGLEPEQEDVRQLDIGGRRHGLPTLSDTRWLARVDSISAFLANIEAVNNALAEIQATSASQSFADAYSYIHSISQFSYIYTAVITQYLLAFIRPLSIALQAKDCNLVDCHDNAQELIRVLSDIRSENDKHEMLLRRAVVTAGKIDVQPSKPRTAGKQRHRANAQMEDDSIEGFYRVNFFYPFIDHIISHLQTRFPSELRDALIISYILPGYTRILTGETEDLIYKTFEDDLPKPTEFFQEDARDQVLLNTYFDKIPLSHCNCNYQLIRWKKRCLDRKDDTKKLNDALNSCDETFYPNVSTLLNLLLTLPVGSCSCERSFSSLRHLKTWSRSTMTECKLNGLALMYIHHHRSFVKNLNPMQVLRKWDETGHRRIAVAFDFEVDCGP